MVIIAITTSTLYFILTPLDEATPELLSRVKPTLLDVFIAIFGGLAGIVAGSRKEKNNVVSGVAIATALMPPLCTAGFGLAELNGTYLFGALYLYIINTVFIGMATFLACRLLRMPVLQTKPEHIGRAQRIAGTVALLTFLPAVYLGYDLFQKTRFNNNANTFIEQACVLEDNYLFSSNIDYDKKTIELVYGGASIPDSTVAIMLSKKDQFNLNKANIKIIQSFSKPISAINEGLKSVYMQMDAKDLHIQQLKQEYDTLRQRLLFLETQSELINTFDQINKLKCIDLDEIILFICFHIHIYIYIYKFNYGLQFLNRFYVICLMDAYICQIQGLFSLDGRINLF